MSKPIDKLVKLLQEQNIAEVLDDETKVQIVQDVLTGYKIDEDSRANWLETNKEAMRIIKHCEDDSGEDELEIPIYKSAKVIYQLLPSAIIQLSARMIQHVVRNDRAIEIAALGKDEQVPENPQEFQQFQQLQMMLQQNPQMAQQVQASGQMPPPPKMMWKKKDRAKRVGNFLNYDVLIDSDTWLKDMHKTCAIVAAWGTSFKQVTYDPITKKIQDELLPPEDVIINHNVSCIEKAARVTIRHYMTKNDIIEQIRAGYFSDVEDMLDAVQTDDRGQEQGEIEPASIVYCQYINLDLDEDGYAEPYKVYVHDKLQKVLGIFPAFDIQDIRHDEKGVIQKITRELDLIDDHCIDDPEGGYYSLGLNYLLLHSNKSITSLIRQLLDAGSLANAAGCTGFITNAFQTRERNMEFKLGEYKYIEVNPNVDPRQHVIPLPARDPSQVLLGLLEMMINNSEKTGFITDALTGDVAGQNVPATTQLSIVEQGTRAFKPIIQKFWIARKKEFKKRCKIYSQYLDEDRYIAFNDGTVKVGRDDFNLADLDICPVADPTQSSEAHKYAQVQFHVQMLQQRPNVPEMNGAEVLKEIYEGMGVENPERFIVPPAPPPPDPKMEKVRVEEQRMQLDAQNDQQKTQIDAFKAQSHHDIAMMQLQIKALQAKNDQLLAHVKERELHVQQLLALETSRKNTLDSRKGMHDSLIKEKLAEVAKAKVEVDKHKNKGPKKD